MSNNEDYRFKYTDTLEELDEIQEEYDEETPEYQFAEQKYKLIEKMIGSRLGSIVNERGFLERANLVEDLGEDPEVNLEDEIDYDNIAKVALEEMRNLTSLIDYETTAEEYTESSTIPADQDFTQEYTKIIEALTNDLGAEHGHESLINVIDNGKENVKSALVKDGELTSETIRENVKDIAARTDRDSKYGEFEELYFEAVGTALTAYGLNEDLIRIKEEHGGTEDLPTRVPDNGPDTSPEPEPETEPDTEDDDEDEPEPVEPEDSEHDGEFYRFLTEEGNAGEGFADDLEEIEPDYVERISRRLSGLGAYSKDLGSRAINRVR